MIFQAFSGTSQFYYNDLKLKSFICDLRIYSHTYTLSLSNTKVIIWSFQLILSETLKLLSSDLSQRHTSVQKRDSPDWKKNNNPFAHSSLHHQWCLHVIQQLFLAVAYWFWCASLLSEIHTRTIKKSKTVSKSLEKRNNNLLPCYYSMLLWMLNTCSSLV